MNITMGGVEQLPLIDSDAKERKRIYERSPARQLAHRKRQRERSRRPEIKLIAVKYVLLNPERRMANKAKERSKKLGVPFAITWEDITIPRFCPVLDIPTGPAVKHKDDYSPTLDRLIPEKGYVAENIAIISERANRIKNNGTAHEHYLIADWMEQRAKGAPDSLGEIHDDSVKLRKKIMKPVRQRANRLGLVCTLQKDDIVVPRYCPILGIPLIVGKGKLHDNSPTVDRIDPKKGYTVDNTAIISHRANRLKNDGSAEEHRRIAAWMDFSTNSKEACA